MKYLILYVLNIGIHSKTNRIEIDAESLDEAIYKFTESVNGKFGDVHLAIFDENKENIYEGELYIPRILTKQEQEIIAWHESLPQRVAKVKSILRDCGIRIKVVSYDYESEITFEYKGEKILDEDDCRIDMYEDQ